ncbi:MAG TPA: SDR family oxidoreductase [Geminicoccaceae bacterium]|nr:SDR family oxidoreductase [Geminicoccaceae bacterium]
MEPRRRARAGRRAELVPGDIAGRRHRTGIVGRAVSGFGRLDILVNDAAVFQRTCERTDDITAGEWDRIFRVNVHAMFYLSQAAVPHMRPGAAIVNATSVQAKDSPPQLLAYAATKGAISTLTATPARMPAGRGIRVNAVAPGPIWTPPIPSTMPAEKAAGFGQRAPRARASRRSRHRPSCRWRRTGRATSRGRWCR